MVDTISNTRGIGRGATRYAPSPAASVDSEKAVLPATSSTQTGAEGNANDPQPNPDGQGEGDSARMRLEVREDPIDGELVYRFIDPKTGEVLREWDSRDLGRLRDYMRKARIHLIDTKI
ncbi:MAG: hypothetical protein KGO02_15465 [Alphaproteobacteria bacterium]|nr:hypothetical protein [Alphaproteobacteria bacterium]